MGVSSGSLSSAGAPGRPGSTAGAAHDLVEQLLDPLGEDRDLLLLEGHASYLSAAAGLQEEGPLTGRADGACDEPLGGS